MKYFSIALAVMIAQYQSKNTLHKIKQSESAPVELMTENDIFKMLRNNQHFFDLTGQPEINAVQTRLLLPVPSKLSYPRVVKALQNKVNIKTMSDFLEKYSSFHDRYYANENGVKAALFLFDQVKKAGEGFPGKFSVSLFNHTWPQPSIIARLEGKESPENIVIVGSHLDSINVKDPKNGQAPGADDDGTGVTSILEAIRSLAKSGFVPKQTVEFQFYSAEEVGLRGSQDIANTYMKQKKSIVGMLQLDMTGYNLNNKVKIITDFTDPELTQFLRSLIDAYSKYERFDSPCGYACSDHASYFKAGFRSARPAEEVKNPKLHTIEDTLEHVDFENVAEYARIAISFIIELAQPFSS